MSADDFYMFMVALLFDDVYLPGGKNDNYRC